MGLGTDPSVAGHLLEVTSDAGSYVGSGRSVRFTDLDGAFEAHVDFEGSIRLDFTSPDRTAHWQLTFSAPYLRPIIPGPYEGARRFTSISPAHPGLEVAADHRGCNRSTGRFDVLEIALGPGGSVDRFAAEFEQFCDYDTANGIHGRIYYDASGPPFPPPPDSDGDGILDTLDDSRNVANAAQEDADRDGIGDACDGHYDNTFLFVSSEPGDYVGGGQTKTIYAGEGAFTLSTSDEGLVYVRFFGEETWFLGFGAPWNAPLERGIYERADRMLVPTDPYLYVVADTRGCGANDGWFEVLEAGYGTSGELQRFAATFEQHCDQWSTGTLRGEVLYDASDTPFPPPADADGDGLMNTLDDCPLDVDPLQADADKDGVGDACDPTFDNTVFHIVGEPGSHIADGMDLTIVPADGAFTVEPNLVDGFLLRIHTDRGWWELDLRPSQGAAIEPGSYAYSFPFGDDFALVVAGEGRGCSKYEGSFDLLEAEFSLNGGIERFAADFEQRCDSLVGKIVGQIRWNASPQFALAPELPKWFASVAAFVALIAVRSTYSYIRARSRSRSQPLPIR
jgi:hypothetical protein